MTNLASRKSKLTFEVEAEVRECGKYRKIVLEPKPFSLELRLKGTRTRLEISYEAIYSLAAKQLANQLRAEKKAKRVKG